MQNPIFRFRQSSITSQKPGCFSEKMKNLMSSDYHKVQYFLPKFCTRFLLDNVYKSAFDFCFILFRSCVIDRNQVFWIFANNLRSKQSRKKPPTPFYRHWQMGNVCGVLAKNMELYGIWSSSKISIF